MKVGERVFIPMEAKGFQRFITVLDNSPYWFAWWTIAAIDGERVQLTRTVGFWRWKREESMEASVNFVRRNLPD